MITIIADPHAYQEKLSDGLCASGPRDYVHVRSAIRRALNSGQSLTVLVTDQLLLHWFSDLAEYEEIEWTRIAPEADYRRIFGAEPMAPFTPDLLIALNIATMNAPPPESQIDPVAWVLGERLHSLWAVSQGNAAHLTQLLSWTIRHTDKLESYLHPLIQQRLTVWANDYPAYAALRAGSLGSNATNVIRRAALQRYDSAWLREQGLADLPLIESSFEHTLWVNALRDLTPAIARYWQERIAQSTPNVGFVQAAIERMSGRNIAEVRAIEGLLRQYASLLNVSLLQALRRRFADLPEAAAILDELETLTPPAQPALPQEEWSDDQWLAWATNEYMPYFAWTVRAHQPRDHQQACALAYEMWLARRYPDWLTSAGSPLVTRQFTLLRDLLNAQPNTVVVWLVVDGMTWWQGRMLREVCRHKALFPQRSEVGVALLPSLTGISKRALVTGLPITEPPRGTIAQAAREKLERAGLRGYVGYDTREIVDALRNSDTVQCLIWFANMLDQFSHSRQDFADDAIVRAYLEELGRNLAQMQTICIEQGRHFHVLVGSDHGSTLLPPDAPTRRLPQATREVIDVWEGIGEQPSTNVASARAALVSDAQRLQIDQPEAWHHLARLRYQLPQDYLVPRGYAAIGRRPSGWTHGGLTPEETIVPLMHLAPEPITVQNLSITISGQVRSQQAGSLTLVLANPNPAPFDKLTLQIADVVPVSIERIAAAGRYETTVTLPARTIEGPELRLTWQLESTVLGIEHHQHGETRIAVRRLQTEDSFDDLFG